MIKYYITITIGLTLTIGALVWGSYNYPPLGNITPEHLQLKAPKERIGPHHIITKYDYDKDGNPIEETKEEYILYKYVSENPSQLFENEILEKRTVNTITQSLGKSKYVATGFLGQKFYKETQESDWYDVFHATTTIDAFETQMEVSLISRLFGKALADDTGWQSPGTMANDESIGTVGWGWLGFDVDRAKASDDDWTYTDSLGTSGDPETESIKLVKGGTIQGDDKAVPTGLTTSEQQLSYGGAEDKWGLSISDTEVNGSDFGFVYAGIRINISNYLKATNFGFSVSGTIDGVVAEVEIMLNGTLRSNLVDHMQMTIYYTEAAAEEAPPTQIFHVR